jgi:carbon storage regulator CsrA
MLVLSRRLHERIVLPTLGITITVVAVKPGVVRLGIEAPPDVAVLRKELLDRSPATAARTAATSQPCLA